MKKIHFWLSLPSGILISLICFTGALMVFQQDLLELCNNDRYYVSQPDLPPYQLDSLVAQVNSALVNDTITSVKFFSESDRTIEASLSSGSKSYVYLDPYTAQINGYYNSRQGFWHHVMTLHRWLMLPDRATGRIIVGISTIFLIFILITGIVRWWKSKSLTIKFRSAFARRLFDLHRVIGIYTSVLLLVCALTGLMWSFNWYRSGVAALFGIKTSQSQKSHNSKKKSATSTINWQQAYDLAVKSNPSYDYIRIDQSGTVTILDAHACHPRATDSYELKPPDLIQTAQYGDVKNQSYMMGLAYVIHVGLWGGSISKWLTFFAAIFGGSLPITGYLLYFSRLNKHRKKHQIK